MNKFYFSSRNNEYLTRLRTEFDIDRLFKAYPTQLTKVQAVAKWVFIDPQVQTFAMRQEQPLNAVELKNAMQNGEGITFVGLNQQDSIKYQQWLHPYLYYIDINSHTVYAKTSKNQKYRFAVQGAKNPQVFQIKYPISDAILVHSPQSIYQTPTLID